MATTLQIDPIAAAVEAVEVHFAGLFPPVGFTVARGWPEHPEPYKAVDQQAARLSVLAVGREWEEISPKVVSQEPGVGGADVLYKVAQLRIRAQMDLWADYRAGADVLGQAVETGFHNRLPWKGGLELLSAGYFDRPLTVTQLGGPVPINDDASVSEGMWHRRWECVIDTDLVVRATQQPTQSEIRFQLSTLLGGDTVQDPDYVVPAAP